MPLCSDFRLEHVAEREWIRLNKAESDQVGIDAQADMAARVIAFVL
jgi:hypothetical protein